MLKDILDAQAQEAVGVIPPFCAGQDLQIWEIFLHQLDDDEKQRDYQGNDQAWLGLDQMQIDARPDRNKKKP